MRAGEPESFCASFEPLFASNRFVILQNPFIVYYIAFLTVRFFNIHLSTSHLFIKHSCRGRSSKEIKLH